MVKKSLESDVNTFVQLSSDLEKRREGLTPVLGKAISDRIIWLYGRRENRSASFELWLSQQFSDDGFGKDLFEADPTLTRLKNMVDWTHGQNGRFKVAKVANGHLRTAGHEFGIGDYFVDVALLTGRRLSHNWHGNPPAE